MKTFVFRNNTIEPFFPATDYYFSGYDDISVVPEDAESFLWFYQVPLRPETVYAAEEINGYIDKMSYVVSQIPAEKRFVILTIANTCQGAIIETDRNLAEAIENFNSAAYELAKDNNNVKVIDINDFCSRYSEAELIDWKFWFLSQMSLNPKLAKPFKAWFEGKMRGIAMKRKKCLVLDLDNTLWGGILGEDGIDGIKIGGDYPGKAFAWWQKALVELGKTGIILTLCSKNNEKDVLEAWEKNPFIILKDKHISAYRINWQDKSSNIQELAQELNIGLDSMVFVDDNPTERELIKQMLPMVSVPDFPIQPYELPRFFEKLVEDYFQAYTLTDEDRKKTEQYKANADRAKAQKTFSNFEDFLRSLEIKVTIEAINSFNLPRIAQMTQKTNQFNLTTKRYSEADLHQFMKNRWKIWCISVADRFGDNGITGCIMVDDRNNIDTLLLSCRILGKGIEHAFVKSVFLYLKESGVEQLNAKYIPTAKNSQVADFYDKCGFLPIGEENGTKSYILDLVNYNPKIEDYYQITFK